MIIVSLQHWELIIWWRSSTLIASLSSFPFDVCFLATSLSISIYSVARVYKWDKIQTNLLTSIPAKGEVRVESAIHLYHAEVWLQA
jgi:hypothetical protein